MQGIDGDTSSVLAGINIVINTMDGLQRFKHSQSSQAIKNSPKAFHVILVLKNALHER